MSQKQSLRQSTVDSGRWEHCSPELRKAGIDCETTLRRPCGCGQCESHDHFISGDRLEISTFDVNGRRVDWYIGPTQAKLLADHNAGKCGVWCAYCITEAEDAMAHIERPLT